jgi:perosamine synthetase
MFNSRLVQKIREMYKGAAHITLHAPTLTEIDKKSVADVIDSGFVSSVGKEVTLFEEELAKFTGSKKAVAVSNGTAALHLALMLSGVKRDELVITQALTFIATANAISYLGAEPVFLDSDMDTLGLSPDSLYQFLVNHAVSKNGQTYLKMTGKRIAACVPMHVFGHPVRIDEIMSICREWGIAVIEDAAEALGSYIDVRHAGTIAPIGVLSFNGNKIITTGGGGALLFNDEVLAQKAKHLSTTAKKPHPWLFYHDEIGYNYRMPNLNAALGCSQLKQLPEFIRIKRDISAEYERFFEKESQYKFISARNNTTPNFWLNAILVNDKTTRDQFLKEMNELGIGSRPVWELLSDLEIYSHCIKDDLKNARFLADRLVNLPSGVPL